MKLLRKAAAQIAVQLPERTYKARVGSYIHMGDMLPKEFRVATGPMIRYEIKDYPRNRMRVAKNAVLWEVKQGRIKL